MEVAGGWGPEGKRAAISVTFDNLGEIGEISNGMEPELGPSGRHYSIEVLPRLLDVLGGVRLTYFVEGWNCTQYPEAIRAIHEAGHEVAAHGWRHENWASTQASERPELLEQAISAFRDLGIDVAGFRPPGGVVDVEVLQAECREVGLLYASPAGEPSAPPTATDGQVSMPFAWKHVDAYVMHEGLDAVRTAFGDRAAAYPLSHWRQSLDQLVDEIKSEGAFRTIIVHPFMLGRDAEYFDCFEAFIAQLAGDDEIWMPTCADFAAWFLDEA